MVDGVRVFYRRVPGDGTPVVYCHGNPTHGEDWLPFLERGGAAIAIDMPGWGRSDRPDAARFDYSMYGLSAFLERCLDELGVTQRKLVVHDWGALALIGAQRRPRAGREARRDQRGAAAARLPLALGRADLAAPAVRRDRQRDDDALGHGADHAPGPRRPQPDAPRVHRHGLAPLGQGHPSRSPGPLPPRRPRPPGRRRQGPEQAHLPLPGPLGQTETPTSRPASQRPTPRPSQAPSSKSSQPPATGPGSTTPESSTTS